MPRKARKIPPNQQIRLSWLIDREKELTARIAVVGLELAEVQNEIAFIKGRDAELPRASRKRVGR